MHMNFSFAYLNMRQLKFVLAAKKHLSKLRLHHNSITDELLEKLQ